MNNKFAAYLLGLKPVFQEVSIKEETECRSIKKAGAMASLSFR